MKKISKLQILSFLTFSVFLSSIVFNQASPIKLITLRTIQAATFVYGYRFLEEDSYTKVMNYDQKLATRSFIKKVSPTFKDSCTLRRQLTTPDNIRLKEIRIKKPIGQLHLIFFPGQYREHLAVAGRAAISIALSPHTQVEDDSPTMKALSRYAVARELAHYKYHDPIDYYTKSSERMELEADLEAFKMLEKHDPETLDFYLKEVSLSLIPSERHLDSGENLFLWNWYKIEREKKGFDQRNLLTLYMKKREDIRKKLPKISKEQLANQTERMLKKVI